MNDQTDYVSRIKDLYDSLIDDKRFDELELGLNKPNLFEILRIPRREIRHSNFLSWLLDPKGSHGLGDIFLRRFVRKIFSSDKVHELDQIEVSHLDFSNAEVWREWQYIDVLIAFDDVVVCVENKVSSGEHSNQLSRYKTIVEQGYPNRRQAFVYLTPEGDESEEETDTYVELSWKEIVVILERIIAVNVNSMSGPVRTYIADYIVILKRYVIGEDELTDLAKEIYTSHTELLDLLFRNNDSRDIINRIRESHEELFSFIERNKPDLKLEIRAALVEVLEGEKYIVYPSGKYWIDFTTQDLYDLTYQNKIVKKTPTIWFAVGLSPRIALEPYTNITYGPVIGQADEAYDRSKILELASQCYGNERPIAPTTNYAPTLRKSYESGFADFNKSYDIGKLKEEFRKTVHQFSTDITKMQETFLECREELLELKRRAEKAY